MSGLTDIAGIMAGLVPFIILIVIVALVRTMVTSSGDDSWEGTTSYSSSDFETEVKVDLRCAYCFSEVNLDSKRCTHCNAPVFEVEL